MNVNNVWTGSALEVCIIGDGVFKFFRLQEGTFKGIPNQLNKMREASRLDRSVCVLPGCNSFRLGWQHASGLQPELYLPHLVER